MRRKSIEIISIIVVFLLPFQYVSFGQDPQFTQFYSAPVYLGPSFAGSSGDTRFIINCRDQWVKLPGDYVTYSMSIDHYLEKYRSGIGLLLLRDEAAGGLINTTDIGFNYNYGFNITRKWRMSPGIQVYYYNKNIDYNKLTFSDQISRDYVNPVSVEMERLSTVKGVNHLDVTASLLGFSDNCWAGFTVDHILVINKLIKNEEGYVPLRLSLYGGGKYFISNRLRSHFERSITGAFNFMYQDDYKYLDLGAYYTHAPMLFGLWFRGIPVFSKSPNVGALTFQLGYKIDQMTIGYSYDYTLSSLMTKTGGAHELSIAYEIKSDTRRRRMRMVPCPTLL